MSLNPASASLYICLSKSFINISVDFFADLFNPSSFLSSFLVCTLNGPPDLKFSVKESIARSIEVFALAPYSEYFQRSDLGIPDFVKALSARLDVALNNFGMPDLSLANTFVIPVNAGSTTLDNITPDPVDNVFTDGPTNLSAPKNAVPSVPNFNLFLNTAAAYS